MSTSGLIVGPAHKSLNLLQSVNFTKVELDDFLDELVFSHNDLEPCNIIVRKISRNSDSFTDGKKEVSMNDSENSLTLSDLVEYQLVGIIDWELSGFFPPCFEQAVKDCQLGPCDLRFDWYRLFRNKSSPRAITTTQKKLLLTLDMACQSFLSRRNKNFPLRRAQKWLKREQLVHVDVQHGWARKSDTNGFVSRGKKEN